MSRWPYPRENYPPLNQTHDPRLVIDTWPSNDDKNRAAVYGRGPNTSYNHFTGQNFTNVPLGEGDQQGYMPDPRWHFTTAHIRNESTWTNPPGSMYAYYEGHDRPGRSRTAGKF